MHGGVHDPRRDGVEADVLLRIFGRQSESGCVEPALVNIGTELGDAAFGLSTKDEVMLMTLPPLP
jgi:hypothetical protein